MAKQKEDTAVKTVVMEDGRSVEFAGTRNLLKNVLIDREAGKAAVRFDFSNGRTFLFQVPGPALPGADGILLECAAHGASQKIGDETAGAESVDDSVMAVQAMIERLQTGDPKEWRKRNEGGGKAFSGASLLLEAMLRRYPEAQKEALEAYVKGLTKPERDAMQRHPQMEPFVKAVQAERDAKKGINADDLEAKLQAVVQPGA